MNARDIQQPVDRLHAQCMDLRDWLNRQFEEAKRRAALWEPGQRF